jgi:KUP system potassium uptake protein
MVVDGLVAFVVVWKLWHWTVWQADALILLFFIADITFFSANFQKLLEGAWVSILFGTTMVLIIPTRRRGSGIRKRHEALRAQCIRQAEDTQLPRSDSVR